MVAPSMPAVLADAEQPGQSVLEGGTRVPAGTSQRLARDATPVLAASGRRGACDRGRRPDTERFLRRFEERCSIVTRAVASRVAACASGRVTTSTIGPTAARRRSRTLRCCAAGITGAVHEEGFQVERQPDGELQFRRPNGVAIPQVPQSPDLPADPVAAHSIAKRSERAGLFTRARRCRTGEGSVSTSPTPSTYCIRGRDRNRTLEAG